MGSDLIKVIGMMSGTSVDGLDLAYCEFWQESSKWKYRLLQAATFSYPPDLYEQLVNVTELPGESLILLDRELGNWYGEKVNEFINSYHLQPDLVASHGHTVFHQPEKGLTYQIGNGLNIMLATGLTVINDFRTQDLALGGQGAPLVPIGDKLLFGDYDGCLNLGGFANISADLENRRIAYDICAVNTVLNFLARKAGQEYDSGGQMAASGQLVQPWLDELNQLTFYRLPYPKSLGIEWVKQKILPVLEANYLNKYPLNDLMRTYTEHVALQLAQEIKVITTSSEVSAKKILVTGGGAYNNFLISHTQSLLGKDYQLVVPDNSLVENKEALVFALLGVLKYRQEVNILSSVTGASKDHSSGILFIP